MPFKTDLLFTSHCSIEKWMLHEDLGDAVLGWCLRMMWQQKKGRRRTKMMKKKNPFDDKQNFHEFSSCVLIIEFASKWHEEMWLLLLQIVKIRICCLCTYLLNMFVTFHLQTDGVELTVVSLNDFFQFEKLSISIEPFNHFWHHLAKKPFLM